MNLARKLFALAAFAFLAPGAFAQGQDYGLLNPPQPTEGGGKVEVLEFFWYGCPHCYRLEPFVEKWAANLPKDVVFKRVHALPGNAWIEHATIFNTLEAMGLLEKLHRKVFDAIHQDNQNLASKPVREAWLAKQGVDVAKYNEVAKSFAVVTKLNRAQQMTASYKVDGVPMLFVNGKYVTSNTHTQGDTTKIMAVVDRLVDMARKESAPAPAPKK
jgi:protein dithiol oxidoreductase (disulfide-forming)